jgi:hypothetical protein
MYKPEQWHTANGRFKDFMINHNDVWFCTGKKGLLIGKELNKSRTTKTSLLGSTPQLGKVYLCSFFTTLLSGRFASILQARNE